MVAINEKAREFAGKYNILPEMLFVNSVCWLFAVSAVILRLLLLAVNCHARAFGADATNKG